MKDAATPSKHLRLATATAWVTCVVFVTLQTGCLSTPQEDPTPPGGGQRYVLDYGTFAVAIDSMLTARGCDNARCHGGGIRGTYQLSPDTDKDLDMDFEQSILQVNGNDPAASPILMKPLAEAAGGDAHAGGEAFTSTGDDCYQAILSWIEAGTFQ